MSFEKPELPMLDPNTLKPSLNPILVVDGVGLEKVKKFLAEPKPYVHDYETQMTNSFYRRRARTLQLGNKDEQFIIDLLAFADGSTEKLIHGQGGQRKPGNLRMYNEEETSYKLAPINLKTFQPIVDTIQPSMESDAWLKIGFNLEFEYIVSKWCLGLRPWHFYDCFLAERLLWNGAVNPLIKGFWSMGDVVARYFKFRIDKESQTSFNLHDPLTQEQITYTALDIRLPWAVEAMQEPKIESAGLVWTAQIENDAVPAFGDMKINGLYVNPMKWQTIIDDNVVALAKALEELDEQYIPLVGLKELPDPERVAVAHAAFKACDKPTVEEDLVSAQIKQAVKDKNPELKAQLLLERDRLQAERAEHKAAAKEYHKSISYLATKGFADEVAKMDGKAAINYGAWQQVLKALHAHPNGLFDKKTLPNLNAKTTLIKFMHLPIIKSYVKFKQVSKQLETYGYRWITTTDKIARDSKEFGFVDPDTGRIHSSFRQLGTDTGRPSSTNPNVLNLPREGKFREVFESRLGFDMVTKDCSGQELRILCDYSHEPSWVDAFTTNKDVHSISARMFRTTLWDSTQLPNCAYFHQNFLKCKCAEHKKIRDRYKAVTLGVIMGKQSYSLAIEMEIEQEEAQALIDEWFDKFKKNKAAIEHNQESAYTNGEARTRSGRRRIIQRVLNRDAEERAKEKYPDGFNSRQLTRILEGMIAAAKREAGNVPYQGTGADLMKLAMGCGFDPEGVPFMWHVLEPDYNAMLLNYVYDEFLVETPEEHSTAVGGPDGIGGVISDAIIRAGALLVKVVPMASEGAIAKTWSK